MTENCHREYPRAQEALLQDLENLVRWSHSHSAICYHIPRSGGVIEGTSEQQQQLTVLWQCLAGHAYNWPFIQPFESGTEEELSNEVRTKRPCKPSVGEDRRHVFYLGDGQNTMEVDSDDGSSSLVIHTLSQHGDSPKTDQNVDFQSPSSVMKKRSLVPPKCNCPEQPEKLNSPIETNDQVWWFEKGPYSEENVSSHVERDSSPTGFPGEINSDDDCTAEDEGRGKNERKSLPSNASCFQAKEEEEKAVVHSSSPFPAAKPSQPEENQQTQQRVTNTIRQLPMTGLDAVVKFQRLLEQYRPGTSLNSLAAEELDDLLKSFFLDLQNDEEQELNCSLLRDYRRKLHCYFRRQGCTFRVTSSAELASTSAVFHTLNAELQTRERDQVIDLLLSLDRREEDELRHAGFLGRNSPEALIGLLLLNSLRAFGKAHTERPWPLRFSEFQLVRKPAFAAGDRARHHFLEWKDPEGRLRRMHALPHDAERCPLQDFMLYTSRHEGGVLRAKDAFYSSIQDELNLLKPHWYNRTPMTRVRFDKITRKLSQQLQRIRLKNPSVIDGKKT